MHKRRVDGSAMYYMENPTGQVVYTIKVELHETVDLGKLKTAVAAGLQRHPALKVKMHKGFTSYYYVPNEKFVPIQERETILEDIDFELNNGYLFTVTYAGKVINFEFFHALTDGTGSVKFVSTVLKHYQNPDAEIGVEDPEERENAYQRYIKQTAKIIMNTSPSTKLHLKENDDFHVIPYRYPVNDVIKIAKAHQCTLTQLIVAAFTLAAIKTQEDAVGSIVSTAVPVDLRRFFPTKTIYNFMSAFNCDVDVTKELVTLSDCIEATKAQFIEKTDDAHIAAILKWASTLENFPVKWLPVFLKDLMIRSLKPEGGPTANFSNLGIIDREGKLADTVKHIDFILPSGGYMPICYTACTFEDSLNVVFSTTYRNDAFFALINDVLLGKAE